MLIRKRASALERVLSLSLLMMGRGAWAQNPSLAPEFMQLRDPFKMPSLVSGEAETRTELELIPIESFKMIGVTTGPDRAKAMLQAQDGRTFFVTEKTKIGVNEGVIERITAKSVQIKEKKVNAMGQEEEFSFEIKFPSPGRM